MSLFFRRFFLVALLVAVAVAAPFEPDLECNGNCSLCLGNFCIRCKKGYYQEDKKCVPCIMEHCADCKTDGRCVACDPGYNLEYMNGSDHIAVNKYGKCVNAASFAGVPTGVPTALVAAAMAVVYAAIA